MSVLTASATDEQWRPAPGFDGYEVSNLGRVLSRHRSRAGVLLKPRPSTRGYGKVALADGAGGVTHTTVHRLVMRAFVGPCPEGLQVRHLDGNPGNNRLSNLAYGTPAENMQDSIEHGTHPSVAPRCRLGHMLTRANLQYDESGAACCRRCAERLAQLRSRRATT